MTEKTLQPTEPFKFFVDADPIAYAGASSAQKTVYKWVKKEGDEIVETSPSFYKALDAKIWIEQELWDGTAEEEGWERINEWEFKDLQDAYDATDEVVADYIKTGETYCREGKDPIFKGWLTKTGHKEKDVKGLEDRYQFNREGLEKPKYLAQCRQYLLDNYPWIVMAKEGYEADTHVVGRAEAVGEDGCTLSIDKDIEQGEGCWHVNMYNPLKYRNCNFATELGSLWIEVTHRGKDKIRGDGFMFLCFQAIAGDPTDGYKGLYGIGEKKAYQALFECTTKLECLQAMEKLYKTKSKKGYECKKLKQLQLDRPDDHTLYAKPYEFRYVSWDGELQTRTVREMMQQHIELAYQERSPNDHFVLSEYLPEGDE